MKPTTRILALLVLNVFAVPGATAEKALTSVRGEVTDAATGKLVPARIYIQAEDGAWHFPRSAGGTAVEYRKQRADNPKCVEMHTTLSAHPFTLDLAPGKYTVTVERGHEYLPLSRVLTVTKEPVALKLPLTRWINLAERGWYSGETHVHRTLEELPNVMLAEDLNVAFPLTAWVTEGFAPPRDPLGKDGAKLITLDTTHVIYPRNTEYEIFTIGKKRHALGAFFIINHKRPFEIGAPPVAPIGQFARDDGALLELDKPNWPWSMMLVALLKVDLYELANNHVWRTEFGFPNFGEKPPDYMKIERDLKGFTERGWIDFGFQNYYALLNCGFRMRPTAGAASGVHPVPLGFGRVYVHLPKGFSYDGWVDGLNKGRSFVTTGPMLFVNVNGHEAGATILDDGPVKVAVAGSAVSARPLDRIEIVVNGEVARTIKPENRKTMDDSYESTINEKLPIPSSAWLVVRCYEDRPDKRIRFAHSSPVHIDIAGKPVRPRRAEVDFLIQRVEDQLKRNADVLPADSLDEYRRALATYQEIGKRARD